MQSMSAPWTRVHSPYLDSARVTLWGLHLMPGVRRTGDQCLVAWGGALTDYATFALAVVCTVVVHETHPKCVSLQVDKRKKSLILTAK